MQWRPEHHSGRAERRFNPSNGSLTTNDTQLVQCYYTDENDTHCCDTTNVLLHGDAPLNTMFSFNIESIVYRS